MVDEVYRALFYQPKIENGLANGQEVIFAWIL